jgi:MFS family permease
VNLRGDGKLSTAFRALGTRNFRLFFGGQLVSQTGTWLTTIASTLLVLSLTDSGVALGLLVACQFGPMLLLGMWGGLVADRSDKRRLLVTTQTLQMVQSFALAGLAFMDHPPLAGFYVLALAGGVIFAFDNPTRKSFIGEMVPAVDVQNAVMLNSALMTAARIFGPAVAGLLVTTVGFAWCFFIDGFSYLAVLAGLMMMRRSELFQPPVIARGRGQLRDGLRYTRGVPDVFIPLVMIAVVGTFAFNLTVVIPLFVERTFHASHGSFTLLFSSMSVGSLLGALLSTQIPTLDLRHVVISAYVFAAALLVFAVAPSLPVAFPLVTFVGLGSVTFMTTSQALMQIRSDPAMRGRVLSLQGTVLIGSTPIGGPVIGLVCDTWGPRAGLLVGGIAAIGAASWGLRAQRHVAPASRVATVTASSNA